MLQGLRVCASIWLQVAQLLLNHGVEINLVDQQGRTALMTAASEGHITSAKLLLDHGNMPLGPSYIFHNYN